MKKLYCRELSSISLDQKTFQFVKPLYAWIPQEMEVPSPKPATLADFRKADQASLKKDVASGALVSIKKSNGTTTYSGNLSLYDSNPKAKESVKATIQKHVEEDKGVISNIDAVINFEPKDSNSTSTQGEREQDAIFLQEIKTISEINAKDLLIKNMQEDDSRNTSVKCEDLKINGNSVSSSDYWAYNCYTDESDKPQSCTTSGVSVVA